jgi:hypothetical protein
MTHLPSTHLDPIRRSLPPLVAAPTVNLKPGLTVGGQLAKILATHLTACDIASRLRAAMKE